MYYTLLISVDYWFFKSCHNWSVMNSSL